MSIGCLNLNHMRQLADLQMLPWAKQRSSFHSVSLFYSTSFQRQWAEFFPSMKGHNGSVDMEMSWDGPAPPVPHAVARDNVVSTAKTGWRAECFQELQASNLFLFFFLCFKRRETNCHFQRVTLSSSNCRLDARAHFVLFDSGWRKAAKQAASHLITE